MHRDVKPQNVLVNGNGEAKVTDFGIARSLAVPQGVTLTGTVLGTSDYISPEQAQGRQVDELTDVYSLGVVVYELLTGEPPFTGDNFVAIAMQHINDPVPPASLRRPEVPPRVDRAIEKALAKEPADRFASMGEFARELESCLEEVRLGADASATGVMPALPPKRGARRATRGRRKGRRLLWLVLLAAVGAGGRRDRLRGVARRERKLGRQGPDDGRHRLGADRPGRLGLVRSGRRRAGASRAREPGDGRQPGDLLGDRELPQLAQQPRQGGRRARAGRQEDGVAHE